MQTMVDKLWGKRGATAAGLLLIAACGSGLGGAPGGLPTPGGAPAIPGAGDAQCTPGKLDIAAGTVGDFGEGAGAIKIEGFLKAAVTAKASAQAVEDDLVSACTAIATDIGVDATRLVATGSDPGARVTAACGTLATELKTYIEANLPQGARLVMSYAPPVCGVQMSAVVEAAAQCDANVQANAKVECEGGHMSGKCGASCTGSCSGKCTGSCQGTCSGTCGGDCKGECEGRCKKKGPDGSCIGKCEGTCRGECTASCGGSCSGSCTGTCDAQCSGECSVEFQEPRCEGQANVEASAECKAQANVQASADIQCTEPQLTVGITPKQVNMDKFNVLIRTLQTNWPKLLVAAHKTNVVLRPSLESFVSVSGSIASSMPSIVVEVGAEAAACAQAAVNVVSSASASVVASANVSVNVSASVSASGKASASASGPDQRNTPPQG